MNFWLFLDRNAETLMFSTIMLVIIIVFGTIITSCNRLEYTIVNGKECIVAPIKDDFRKQNLYCSMEEK